MYLSNLVNVKAFQVTYLEPGQSCEVEARNASKTRIQATAGPVLGPPWQRPENGYKLSSYNNLVINPHASPMHFQKIIIFFPF